MADRSSDPLIDQLRDQIAAADRSLLSAFNTRLGLVERLKRHKESLGLGLVDRGREQSLLESHLDENPGPLSDEGLTELFELVLDLTKRELRFDEEEPPA